MAVVPRGTVQPPPRCLASIVASLLLTRFPVPSPRRHHHRHHFPPPPCRQHFVEAVAHAVKHKTFPGDGGTAAVTVAELNAGGGGSSGKRKSIIGAIVVSAVNAHAARERGDIPFQLLVSESATTDLAIVKAMVVDRTQRRRGVGTELLYTGVRAVAADPRVQAVR